jgi:CRP-like cAMP-binding protein
MEHDLNTILRAVPLFKPLDDVEIAELAKLMASQSFTANQPIMVEGHPPPGLYVLLDGKVAVMKGKGDGADHICDLDAGECVGEVEIIENAACAASVVAYGNVETAVIVADNLNRYFTAYPNAAVKILRQMVNVLAARLRQLNVNYSSMKTIADGLAE